MAEPARGEAVDGEEAVLLEAERLALLPGKSEKVSLAVESGSSGMAADSGPDVMKDDDGELVSQPR